MLGVLSVALIDAQAGFMQTLPAVAMRKGFIR
jgi:hypothetical protein